jgi:hypothetical protein
MESMHACLVVRRFHLELRGLGGRVPLLGGKGEKAALVAEWDGSPQHLSTEQSLGACGGQLYHCEMQYEKKVQGSSFKHQDKGAPGVLKEETFLLFHFLSHVVLSLFLSLPLPSSFLLCFCLLFNVPTSPPPQQRETHPGSADCHRLQIPVTQLVSLLTPTPARFPSQQPVDQCLLRGPNQAGS